MDTKSERRIILIEDEPEVREAYKLSLELAGMLVEDFDRAEDALAIITKDFPGIIISDIKMPNMDGLQLLQHILWLDPELPVILVTGHGDISMAVDAVKAGAYDFIEKPVSPNRLLEGVNRALQARALIIENRQLKDQLSGQRLIEDRILGDSAIMDRLRTLVCTIADADVDVLLYGETGTGKELVARSLHDFSERSKGEFVALNCGALPDTIIESELFGHEAGSFTGANKRRIGKIEYADGGTLFLDELESMPMHLQIKLLRVLQERALERVGGNERIAVDIRVIAATKRDLIAASSEGEFREDLYYRLNVATINIPALRERSDDILLLFNYFIDKAALRFKRPVPQLSHQQLEILMQYDWPGNIRELQHETERYVLGMSVLLCPPSDEVELLQSAEQIGANPSLTDKVDFYEKRLLIETLTRTNGRVIEAADQLNIPRKKLYLRMKKFDIDKDFFSQ